MASQGDRSIYKKNGNIRMNIISRSVCATIVAEKQSLLLILSMCLLALGIQHAMRMHHTATCGQPGSTVFLC
jgi:hypothetical protein